MSHCPALRRWHGLLRQCRNIVALESQACATPASHSTSPLHLQVSVLAVLKASIAVLPMIEDYSRVIRVKQDATEALLEMIESKRCVLIHTRPSISTHNHGVDACSIVHRNRSDLICAPCSSLSCAAASPSHSFWRSSTRCLDSAA